jgi:hypothetical protein
MDQTALRRLLNIFPVTSIREQWDIGGKTKGDVVGNVTTKALPENIIDFVRDNSGLTKQHVYLFSHSIRQVSKLPESILADFKPQKVTSHGTEREFFYLIPLEFHFVAGSPPEEGSITFLWPVRFVFRSEVLAAYLTTMEKDISTYVPLEPVHRVTRSLQNEQLLKDLMQTLPGMAGLTRLDINKGVKHLWNTDAIDATRVCWKESYSTHTDAMDAEFLLKKHVPKAYREAFKAPLLKTVFKVLDPNLGWPELLMVDSTNGEIGIPRFSKDRKAVENVVGEILRHN